MQSKLFAIVVLSVVICVLSAPTPPVWPNAWSQKFTETTKIVFTYSTNGSFYYDWTNIRYRVDRQNGYIDRYCGSVKYDETPCSHLVLNGYRYLIFPELPYCCMCCTDADGCGVVMPDWLNNATYLGQVDLNGTTCDKWQKDGLQTNYWYQTEAGVPCELDEVPNDYIYWEEDTYVIGEPDPSLFVLPSYCSESEHCSDLSVCGIARKSGFDGKISIN